MNKYLKISFFVVGIILFTFVIQYTINNNYSKSLKTDSGFDSSWDSGGSSWDSGGSSDSGSSSWDSGSSSGGSGIDVLDGIIIIITIIVFIFGIIFTIIDNNKNLLEHTENKQEELKDAILISYGVVNKTLFKMSLYEIYVEIQKAWSQNDIDKARHLLSDELYNQYKTQILTMKAKNEQNIMGDFIFVDAKIINIQNKDKNTIFKVQMEVKCKDYMINSKTQKVTRGDKKKENNYLYELEFRTSNSKNIDTCPNCNAKLKDGASTKCEYCGSEIVRETNGFVLQRKTMVKQR